MYSLVTYKEVSDIRLVTGGVCSYDNNARQGSFFSSFFGDRSGFIGDCSSWIQMTRMIWIVIKTKGGVLDRIY